MGASKYEIELDQWTGTACDGSNRMSFVTPIPAWTPQGSATGSPAIGNAGGASRFGRRALRRATACRCGRTTPTRTTRRSRATGRSTPTSPHRSSPTRSTPPTGNAPCNGGLWLCPQYYVTPVNSSESQTPPVFVWKPLTGARGYYVVVSKDPNFSNIIDYVYTNETVPTPRARRTPTRRSARSSTGPILPTSQPDGTGSRPPATSATLGNKQVFNKQSIAPAIQPPDVSGAGVTFQWSPLIGAAYYSLQVSTDASFSNILEDVNTDSASYTAAKSYPAAQTLYYRVRANDASGNGLTWATGVFTRTLAAPVVAAATGDINPVKLDGVPNWSWSAVPGATAYDIHVDYPNGSTKDVDGIHGDDDVVDEVRRPGRLALEGARRVRQRQHHGAWSDDAGLHPDVRRADGSPHGGDEDPADHLLGSEAGRQDLPPAGLERTATSRPMIDDVTQDATRFAPTLTSQGYTDGGTLLWRVAPVDAEGNQGDWSAVAKIALAQRAQGRRRRRAEPRQDAADHDHGDERQGRGRQGRHGARRRRGHAAARQADEQEGQGRPAGASDLEGHHDVPRHEVGLPARRSSGTSSPSSRTRGRAPLRRARPQLPRRPVRRPPVRCLAVATPSETQPIAEPPSREATISDLIATALLPLRRRVRHLRRRRRAPVCDPRRGGRRRAHRSTRGSRSSRPCSRTSRRSPTCCSPA